MKNAFVTHDFADLTFRFPAEENATIKAHKIVLASRSDKFKNMLLNTEEESVIIDITVLHQFSVNRKQNC